MLNRDEIIDYLQNVLCNIKTDYVIINLYSKINRYKPMRRDTIEDIISRLGKKAGIDDLHPHMFRPGIAVDMLEKGCDMVQIKDKLRHRSISTTTNIYAEVNDKARKDAMTLYFNKIDTDFTPDAFSMNELADLLMKEDTDTSKCAAIRHRDMSSGRMERTKTEKYMPTWHIRNIRPESWRG